MNEHTKLDHIECDHTECVVCIVCYSWPFIMTAQN